MEGIVCQGHSQGHSIADVQLQTTNARKNTRKSYFESWMPPFQNKTQVIEEKNSTDGTSDVQHRNLSVKKRKRKSYLESWAPRMCTTKKSKKRFEITENSEKETFKNEVETNFITTPNKYVHMRNGQFNVDKSLGTDQMNSSKQFLNQNLGQQNKPTYKSSEVKDNNVSSEYDGPIFKTMY